MRTLITSSCDSFQSMLFLKANANMNVWRTMCTDGFTTNTFLFIRYSVLMVLITKILNIRQCKNSYCLSSSFEPLKEKTYFQMQNAGCSNQLTRTFSENKWVLHYQSSLCCCNTLVFSRHYSATKAATHSIPMVRWKQKGYWSGHFQRTIETIYQTIGREHGCRRVKEEERNYNSKVLYKAFSYTSVTV
jgi:hypothetical protein